MTTFIPSSEDDLSDPFFNAWFDAWRNAPEDVDPADTFAIYCAF
jgi:hypothetical protein